MWSSDQVAPWHFAPGICFLRRKQELFFSASFFSWSVEGAGKTFRPKMNEFLTNNGLFTYRQVNIINMKLNSCWPAPPQVTFVKMSIRIWWNVTSRRRHNASRLNHGWLFRVNEADLQSPEPKQQQQTSSLIMFLLTWSKESDVCKNRKLKCDVLMFSVVALTDFHSRKPDILHCGWN